MKIARSISVLFVPILLLLFTATVVAQWVQTPGPVGGIVLSFAQSGSNMFVGTAGAGVFLSTNDGTTWTSIGALSKCDTIQAVAIVGSNLFIGTASRGVFRTSDNGTTWNEANAGLTEKYVSVLVASGTLLFVGTDNGVFSSTDNGATWTAKNTGLPTYLVPGGGGLTKIYSARALLVRGPYLFYGSNGGGVYRSTDNGTSWVAMNSGIPTNKQVFAFAAYDTVVYAGCPGAPGVLRSTDNGLTWIPMQSGMSYYSIYALAVKDTFILAAGSTLYRATRSDTTWTAKTSGLPSGTINVLGVKGSTIIAGFGGSGMYRTSDNGANWTVTNSGLTAATVNALFGDDSTLYTGTAGSGIFVSTDSGLSWQTKNTGLLSLNIFCFVKNGSTVYAGTEWGVHTTTNAGTTWTSIGPAGWQAYALAVRDSFLYMASSGVRYTTNNGTVWSSATLSGITQGALLVKDTLMFTASRYSGSMSYSTDRGATWQAVGSGLGTTPASSIVRIGADVFVSNNAGIYLSTNNGSNWISVKSGLPSDTVHWLFTVGNFLFAGTKRGVAVTNNKGTTWTNVGLGDYSVRSLAADNTYLYAGTWTNSVWKRTIAELTTTVDKETTPPVAFALHQNYPNPFNPGTTICYDLPAASHVRLIVFDLLGRKIATLVNENLSAGAHRTTWNVQVMPSGVYLCRLQAGTFVETRKLILLR